MPHALTASICTATRPAPARAPIRAPTRARLPNTNAHHGQPPPPPPPPPRFVFGTHHGPDDLAYPPLPRVDCPSTAAEVGLVADVGGRWAGFASQKPMAPRWPLFAEGEGAPPTKTLRLEDADGGGDTVVVDFKEEDCAWWAAHPAR